MMKNTKCVPQKISKLTMGLLMLTAAFGLVIIGVTLLPIFGFILAVPVVALAIYIFSLNLNDQCQIEF